MRLKQIRPSFFFLLPNGNQLGYSLRMVNRFVMLTVLVPLIAMLSCAPSGRPLDPSSADKTLGLPGEEYVHFGSATAYEHHIRSGILTERGDLVKAADELNMALAADPADFYLRIRLSLVLIELNKLKTAHRHIKKTLKWDPDNEYAWLALAIFHQARGDIAEAEAAARRAIRVEPRNHEAALWLASVYRNAGDNKRAAEILRHVADAAPKNADAQLELGEASLALGDYFEARRRLAVFTELRPYRADAIAKLASAHLMTDDHRIGANLLTLAVSKDPSNNELRIKLIRLLVDSGLMRRAALHLLSLRPLEPDDLKGGLRRVCLFARVDRPYHARSLLISHVGPRPEDPNARLVLAELEIQLGRLENAELLLKETDKKWTDEQLSHGKKLQNGLLNWPNGSMPCAFLEE